MTANSPLVSIIIVNFNNAKFLQDSVKSALFQTYPNIELVFADNCSTDDSIEVFESLLSDYEESRAERPELPARKVVRAYRSENGGITLNKFSGVAASTGEFLSFLDADDFLCAEAIEKAVQELSAEVDIVIPSPEVRVSEDERFAESTLSPEVGQRLERSGFESARLQHNFNSGDWQFHETLIHGILFRRTLFDTIEPFDEPSNPTVNSISSELQPHDVYPEDSWLSSLLRIQARLVILSASTWHCYRVNSNSITHRKDDPEKGIKASRAWLNYYLAEANLLGYSPAEKRNLVRDAFYEIKTLRTFGFNLWRRELRRTFFDPSSSLVIFGQAARQTGAVATFKFKMKVLLLWAGLLKYVKQFLAPGRREQSPT